MSEPAFDFSAFLNSAPPLDTATSSPASSAPSTTDPVTGPAAGGGGSQGNGGQSLVANEEMPVFSFDWGAMEANAVTTGASQAVPTSGAVVPNDDVLSFFPLDIPSAVAATPEGSSGGADPFSFFDSPSENATHTAPARASTPCAAPHQHTCTTNATMAMPPPSPLTPMTRQRMKGAPRHAELLSTVPRTAGVQDEEESESVVDGKAVPTAPERLNEEAANHTSAPSTDEAAKTPPSTMASAQSAPSRATTARTESTRGLRASAASSSSASASASCLAQTMTPTRDLVAQSRLRLQRVREREAHSRTETTSLFQKSQHAPRTSGGGDGDAAAATGAATAPAAFTGGAGDTTDTAFIASCAQLTRQVAQTRAEQLRVSEAVQLRATHALAQFGPHQGLASLLGPEYASVPVVHLLPLLVPLFEELLHDE